MGSQISTENKTPEKRQGTGAGAGEPTSHPSTSTPASRSQVAEDKNRKQWSSPFLKRLNLWRSVEVPQESVPKDYELKPDLSDEDDHSIAFEREQGLQNKDKEAFTVTSSNARGDNVQSLATSSSGQSFEELEKIFRTTETPVTELDLKEHVQRRLEHAPLNEGFISAYTVEVDKFRATYLALQSEIALEIGKQNYDECDINVDSLRPSNGKHLSTNGIHSTTSWPVSRPKSASSQLVQVVQPDEIILKVAIYHPELHLRKVQEIAVLGSQRLSELKDKITCMRDDIAKHENMEIDSSFFFIDGIFYDDMRSPNAIRYSKNIMDFIARNKDQLSLLAKDKNRKRRRNSSVIDKHYAVSSMEDVTFRELDLKLGPGYPYVYCHQGCCEHRIAFTDLRLLHEDDKKFVSDYPYDTFKKFARRKWCMICEREEAKYITYGGDKALCSPCVFCPVCLKELYSFSDGKCIEPDVEVYEYPAFIPKDA